MRNSIVPFLLEAYRFGLNPAYDAEANSFDPNYAVVQYTWAPALFGLLNGQAVVLRHQETTAAQIRLLPRAFGWGKPEESRSRENTRAWTAGLRWSCQPWIST